MRVAEIAERVGCDPESAYSKFADTREGTRFHNMQWPTFVTDENYRLFCKALADYANSEEGPQSNGRHELFLSAHELFEKGNEIGGAPKKAPLQPGQVVHRHGRGKFHAAQSGA